jgi:Lon protease-like protein
MSGRRLPMFPLGTVLFPHAVIPLHVFEPRYRALMRDCLEDDRRFGVVLIERGSEVGGGDQRADVGTQGMITRAAELPDGRWVLEVTGEEPVAIDEWLPEDPYPVALVSSHPRAERDGVRAEEGEGEPGESSEEVDAFRLRATQQIRRVRGLLAEHGGAPALPPDQLLDGGGSAEVASWQLCAAAPISTYDAQRLLTAESVVIRFTRLVSLMEELELDVERMLTAE